MRAILAAALLCPVAAWAGPLPGPSLTPTGDASNTTVTVPSGNATALSAILAAQTNTLLFGATRGGSNTTAINKALTAVLGNGGGVVRILGAYAGTFTYSYPDPTVVEEFDGPNINRSMVGMGSAAQDTGKVFSGVLGTTRPSGNDRAGVGFWFWSQGSGSNNATQYDYATDTTLYKQNWNCSTARFNSSACSTLANQGGLGGLNIAVFNGGPDATASPSLKSGSDIINASVTCISGIGDCQMDEMQTIFVDPTSLATTQSMDIQRGVIDTRVGEQVAYGMNFNATAGSMTSGLLFQTSGGSTWNDLIVSSVAGAEEYELTAAGQTNWWSSGAVQYSLGDIGGVLTMQHAGTNVFQISGSTIGLSPAQAWASGLAITLGQAVTNGGYWYTSVGNNGTTTAGNAPTQTSGVFTGTDGITWLYGGTGTVPNFVQVVAGFPTFGTCFQIASEQQTASNVSICASSGAPSTLKSSQGSLYLRTGGGPGRTLYVNETGGLTQTVNANNLNPVLTASISDNIVAAGSTQGTAAALTSRNNIVTSVPVANNGVILAGTSGPQEQAVLNLGGNTLDVYPPVGTAINGGTTNAPVTIAAGASARYLVRSTTDIRTAP